jgi:hypothetical protein
MQQSYRSFSRSPATYLLFLLPAVVLAAFVLATNTRALVVPQSPAPLFVDASASGGGNGLTWQSAYNSLDTALANALTDGQLWVRAGTYAPSSSTTGFHITRRVFIYGGFSGDESDLAQRHGGSTVLDGGGTAIHVVYVDQVTSAAGSPGVQIDRVEVKGGAAQGTQSPDDEGGGVCCRHSDLLLVDDLIDANTARTTGGGVYFEGDLNQQTGAPLNYFRIKRCAIENNHAGHSTGIGHINCGGGVSALLLFEGDIVSTTFTNNDADYSGGAVYLAYTLGVVGITNCVFWKNHANNASQSLGGAVYLDDYGSGVSATSADFRFCTFSDNYLNQHCVDGQAFFCSQYSVPCHVWSSIFYYNYLGCGAQVGPIAGSPTVGYSDVEGTWPGSSNTSAAPLFHSHSIGRLTLRAGSPCIDHGATSQTPPDYLDIDDNGVTTQQLLPEDAAGSARKHDDPNTIDGNDGDVDMGAYEY